MALAIDPASLGLTASAPDGVWGVVMDTALDDDDWHSLVVLADGTASLYTSAAFGIIGAGAHAAVRVAAEALLAAAEQHLPLFGPGVDTAIPSRGRVTLRALTFSGPRVVSAPEEDLGNGRHQVSPVFYAAHEVIGRMRQASGDRL